MRWIKWSGVLAAVILVVACSVPWIYISSKNITVSGIDATAINFGKPGYFHFVAVLFFLLFTFVPKIWAKRSNLIVTAINFAWALRNYFIISACSGGECPEKKIAIYLLIPVSLVMLIAALFPDLKLKDPVRE